MCGYDGEAVRVRGAFLKGSWSKIQDEAAKEVNQFRTQLKLAASQDSAAQYRQILDTAVKNLDAGSPLSRTHEKLLRVV